MKNKKLLSRLEDVPIDPKPLFIFKEAVQYAQPSEYYTPFFILKGLSFYDLYAELEKIGEKDIGSEFLHLHQSKKYPFIYRFCSEQKDDTWDHHAGYFWSSRASVINAAFGVKLMEVVIQETPYSLYTVAMAVDKVAELIPPEYEIVEAERYGELYFEMKKRS